MQDVLTIGIPTFVVLLGILLDRRDSSDLTRHLEALELKFDRRFETLESKVDRRFDVLQHDLRSSIASAESSKDVSRKSRNARSLHLPM